jgi:hypothetical protein
MLRIQKITGTGTFRIPDPADTIPDPGITDPVGGSNPGLIKIKSYSVLQQL